MQTQNFVVEGEDMSRVTPLVAIKAKYPDILYKNAQGYILDSEGHVLYLMVKSEVEKAMNITLQGGDASKVSDYYRQKNVFGVTSDLYVYYCEDGIDSILGLTKDDLNKDNPLEIAYDDDSLLAKIINGVGEDGKATESLSMQDLKSIRSLTIDTTTSIISDNSVKIDFSNQTIKESDFRKLERQ